MIDLHRMQVGYCLKPTDTQVQRQYLIVEKHRMQVGLIVENRFFQLDIDRKIFEHTDAQVQRQYLYHYSLNQ